MAPKEPTRHQLSSRLSYSQHTPTFLRKLQSRVSGAPNEDSDEDPEFEDDGSGRPPIPRRPPVPERPAGDPGSEDEDGDDEAPQVVVLKEGKHLSAWEAENEKRKAKGLPPLPDPWASESAATTQSGVAIDIKPKNKEAKSKEKPPLSFSSGSSLPSRTAAAKRKAAAVGDGRGEDDDEGADEDLASRVRVTGAASSKVKSKKKKPKVGLSFADDA